MSNYASPSASASASAAAVARIERHSDSRPEVISATTYSVLVFKTASETRNAQRILKDFGQEAWVTETGLGLYVS
jgi:hypothetical protein